MRQRQHGTNPPMSIIDRDRDDVTILEGTTWLSWPCARRELIGLKYPPTGESGAGQTSDMDRSLEPPLW